MPEQPPAAIPCVLYAAKSTVDLRGSIPDQLEQCREAIAADARRGVIAEYVDEAISGYRRDRGPGLRDAIEHCEDLAAEHGLAELWAQHSDRLARGDGRSARHTVEIALWALKNDVRVRTLQDPDTFRDLLYAVVTGQRNNEDSKRKAAAAMAGVRRAVARGEFVGTVPDGYKLVRTLSPKGRVHRRLEFDPERSELIELIFRLALRGRTSGQILATVNDRGWLTKPTQRGIDPHAFDFQRIRRIIVDPRYAGMAIREGEILAHGCWPAYITERQHRRLVSRTAHATGRPARWPAETFLLRRLAHCGRCGQPLQICTGTARRDGSRPRAYVCSSHIRHRGQVQCDAKPLAAHVVEAMLVSALPVLMARSPDGTAESVRRHGYSLFAERLVTSQRYAREQADIERIRDWAERESAGRTAETRQETPRLTRILASWFSRIELHADDDALTIRATRRGAFEDQPPVTVSIERSEWARSAPPGARQLSCAHRWTRNETIGTIRGFVDEHGRPPLQKEWRLGGTAHPPDSAVARLFGSWQTAVAAAGYVPAPPEHRTWTDDQILDAVRDWHAKHGCSPRAVDWVRASPEHPAVGVIRTRFGGFANARRLAGVPRPTKPYRKDPWTDGDIREALRAWVAAHGTVPAAPDWERSAFERPNARLMRERFGSWAAALEACGFTPRDPAHYHRRWGREQIIDALALWARQHGRRPTSKDLAHSGGVLPSSFTIVKRFGTLRQALEAAVLPTEIPGRPPDLLKPRGAGGRYAKTEPFASE